MSRLLVLCGLGVAMVALAVSSNRARADGEATGAGSGIVNPIEIGTVQWGRDFDQALKQSGETGKPVLVLFQEVPGCQGCQDFGKTVLSQPLLVEAIEDEFIPVVVYNNQGGQDREILKRYKEPAWNYQVIRFLDAEGKDIIPREDRIWTVGGTAERMIEALTAAERSVPKYLQAVAAEGQSHKLADSAFAMFCYWTGETEIGKLDGVVATEAGWLDGHEVTRVKYDPEQISLLALSEYARDARCEATKVYAPGKDTQALQGFRTGQLDHTYRKARASDQNKQMTGYEIIMALPNLTEMQKTKLNAYIRSEPDKALAWLSPRQQKTLLEKQAEK